MDDYGLDSWLLQSRDIYVSIQTILEASENPCEEMRDRRANFFFQMEQYLEYNSSIRDPNVAFHLSILSALVKYELGKIYFWDNPVLAEKYFADAWIIVRPHYTDPDYILLAVCIMRELNAMAIHKKVCANDAKSYFMKNEDIWKSCEFKTPEHALTLENLFLRKPFRETIRDLPAFDPVYNQRKVFRQSYSDSLAQNLLIAAKEILKDYDKPFEWLRTLYCLADMFIMSQRFPLARYILLYASIMAFRDESTLGKCISNDEMMEKCERVKAKLNDYWGFYSMYLLSFSWNMKQRGETSTSLSQNTSITLLRGHEEKIAHFEMKIPGTSASNYEEAMQILSFGKACLDSAQSYYLKTKRMGEYVSTIEVINKLYENVMYFDDDDDHKYKTHREVIDMMIPQLDNVDPSTHPESNKRMLFQLSLWYIRNLSLIHSPCWKSRVNADDLAVKISNTCSELISCCSSLLNHFPNDGILPDDYSFAEASYALHACATLSNAHAIFIIYNSNAVDDMQAAEEYASKVVFYISKHPEHACLVNSMLGTLKDSAKKIEEYVSLFS